VGVDGDSPRRFVATHPPRHRAISDGADGYREDLSKHRRADLLLTVALSLIIHGWFLLSITPADLVARDTMWFETVALGGALIAGGIGLVGVYYALRLSLEVRAQA
jgi:hypothetical protein